MTRDARRMALLAPGLPHILQKAELNAGYQGLAAALTRAGDQFHEHGIKRVLYYSTGWISVLGHLVQARRELKGLHVDENWYAYGDLPFQFRIDHDLATAVQAKTTAAGYQTRLVDYEGFPVDTGTIVVDSLLNRGRFQTSMISCCVYSDFADTTRLAGVVAQAAEADKVPTALVVVSGLSGRIFTQPVDLREDHFAAPADDDWNRRVLDLLTAGKYSEAEALAPAYAKAAKVDMGFKALAFLKGFGSLQFGKAQVEAYAPVYGTGAAVVRF